MLAAAVASLLATGAGSGCSAPVPDDATVEPFTAHLDHRVPRLLDAHGVPGANIAIVREGEPATVGAYGYAHLDEHLPVDESTRFRAESITKAVTAWGVMRLVEEGVVGLDDPAYEHLTRWQPPPTDFSPEGVTVRRLLSHSAGLPAGVFDEYGPDEPTPSLEEALSGEAGVPAAAPVREPGAGFTYSNVGYGVLELLVEEVSGRDYAAFMEAAVLQPLGLSNATFQWSAGFDRVLATGYDADGRAVPVQRGPVRAHGELHATAGELAAFFAAGMQGPRSEAPGRGILSPESVAELHSPQVETEGFHALGSDAVGLGHFVEELPDGRVGVFHGGEGAGFLNMAYSLPEEGEAIVILTNSKRGWPLLADLLGAWAEWQGAGSVGMTRAFARAEALLWVLAGVAGAGSFWMGMRLLAGVRQGHRRLELASPRARVPRGLQAIAALLLVGLWWLILRDVVSWLLPAMTFRLDWALGALAAVLVLSACLPLVEAGRADGTPSE